MAIGMEVVPTLNLLRNGTMLGTSQPEITPTAIAANIQAVRYRSRKPRREDTLLDIGYALVKFLSPLEMQSWNAMFHKATGFLARMNALMNLPSSCGAM